MDSVQGFLPSEVKALKKLAKTVNDPNTIWASRLDEEDIPMKHFMEDLNHGINPSQIKQVNHPSHYATGKFECIDVMVETMGIDATMDFCVCNAFKYLYRHKRKNGVQDLEKAKWYIEKYIDLQSVKNENRP
jgi:hypothetical protein